jgi:hypothetical protein
MRTEICDIQCSNDTFVFTGHSLQEDKTVQFVINETHNDAIALYEHFFKDKEYVQIVFDCNKIHYAIIDYFVVNSETLFTMSRKNIANNINLYLEKLSTDENKKKEIYYGKKFIEQIDLCKIWGFLSKDKEYTIEDLKFSMKENDMRVPPKIDIKTYSRNNVEVIKKLLQETLGENEKSIYYGKNKLAARDFLSQKHAINATNLNDIELVYRIIQQEYCKRNKIKLDEVRKNIRSSGLIEFKTFFPEWYRVSGPEFQHISETLYNKTMHVENKELKYAASINNGQFGLKFDLKGVSGCVAPDVYKTGDDEVIIEMDVTSMFPSLMNTLGLHPFHMNDKFNDIYGELIKLRFEALKTHAKYPELSNCLKKGLNAIWGKLNKPDSFLFDPILQVQIVVLGELFMCMFIDKLLEYKIDIILVNTDCVIIKAKKSDSNAISRICKIMEEQTGLQLKFNIYDEIVVHDVNNYYLCDIFDGKGVGVFDTSLDLLKGLNAKIISIALTNFFRHGTPIKETIENHKDILDFCYKDKVDKNSKILRSYPCKNEYGTHYLMDITNVYPEPDYSHYIKKVSTIISTITQKQQTLF